MDIPDGPGDGVRWELTSIRSFCESFIKIQLVLADLEMIELQVRWVVASARTKKKIVEDQKKLPACLVKSPEPASIGATVTARYQNPSPDVSLLSLPSPPPTPVPVSIQPSSPPTQMSPVVALSLEL